MFFYYIVLCERRLIQYAFVARRAKAAANNNNDNDNDEDEDEDNGDDFDD